MTTRAASATTLTLALTMAIGLFGFAPAPADAAYKAPWKQDDRALVIDAYEFNPIDWEAMTADKRIAGFINKASDGLPPVYRCGSSGDDAWKLCKNRWWKYSVTKELFMTRRQMAKMKGLLWGAYHLARPGNPREQADHFIDFAEPAPDDLIALDIEDIGPDWMSLEDAEIFADQVKIRTGRYPVLYTNGNTAKHISDNREDYPLLSRLPLWYARYTGDITGKFPEETWESYALWQFSSMHNCNARSCPYRVAGAMTDIDVNVSTYDIAGLKRAWPFDELHDAPVAPADPGMLVASVDEEMRDTIADALPGAAAPARDETTLLAAYGPTGHPKRIDPLKMLNDVARGEPHAAERPHREAKLGTPAPGVPVPQTNPRRPVVAEAAPAEEASGVTTAAPVTERADEAPILEAEAVGASVRGLKEAIGSAVDAMGALMRASPAAIEETASIREAPVFGRSERSKFLRQMQAVIAAREAGALTMPALALSNTVAEPAAFAMASGRGSRIASVDMAALEGVGQRIDAAFSATR